jgi:hypothetical protein
VWLGCYVLSKTTPHFLMISRVAPVLVEVDVEVVRLF